MKEQRIFIYGVPGTGKTYVSHLLSDKLKTQVLEGDLIKKEMQKYSSKEINPILFSGTCTAYREFGELNYLNAIKGLKAVREMLKNKVLNEIKNYQNFILEAAFLVPKSLKNEGMIFLITTIDEQEHKEHFFKHRNKTNDLINSEFKAARIIQGFLIEEAKSLGIKILDNHRNPEELIQEIL